MWLLWPSDRLIVQTLVELECQKWIGKGVNVKYETRNNRNGYKAGALREGLKKHYVEDCEFVVIFDADFQPEKDFLWRTIPYLLENPELALVQARWKFVNADECLMTRLQEMSLEYHFSVEQEVGSSTCQFFGFNGTAGVWRIRALNDAGGWKDRTTVEDMDLAVRASLKGWKFLFVGDLAVKNELPSTFKAYRYQQHRWSCGPANLFRKMFKEIIVSCVNLEEMACNLCILLCKEDNCTLGYLFLLLHHNPSNNISSQVHLPRPLAIYLPASITILNAASTLRHEDPAKQNKNSYYPISCNPIMELIIWSSNLLYRRSMHLLVFWILFENVMSLHRSKATIIGLLEANRVNEWVVTEKLGNTMKQKYNAKASKRPRSRIRERQGLSSSSDLGTPELSYPTKDDNTMTRRSVETYGL
ncbi:hypothetical protein DH2020_040023 [Rehmannia glutinosa]|uniref:Glycosyltransferase 2-like domain-containing protein n=1 Tax=Rehmannia glutinosa TaxID=99300 RepID=A0ABR0UWB5_REHGL